MNKIKRSSRKITVFFLSLLMLLSLAPITVFAENTSGVKDSGKCGADGDNVTWTLYNDGELVISGEGEMAQDWSYDNSLWYDYKEYIMTVIIEDGVTSIFTNAFARCDSLISVIIADSVTSIGDNAFDGCRNLMNVVMSKNIQDLGWWTFQNCEKLDNISIPSGISFIGYATFRGCKNLSQFIIPAGVEYIYEEAFKGCSNLKKIEIPESVIFIYPYSVGYYMDSDGIPTSVQDFQIMGCVGSEAEKYAKDNGFAFIDINSPVEPDTKPVSKDLEPIANGKVTIVNSAAQVMPEMSVKEIKAQLTNENVNIVNKDGYDLNVDELTGTGSKIQVLDNDGKVLSEYEVLVPMDVDGNARISAADARLALRKSAKLEKLEGVFERACNADGNDRINAADARKILRVSAKLEAYSV